MTTAAAQLAAEIARLKSQVQALARGAQLAHSTVRVGADDILVPEGIGVGIAAKAQADAVAAELLIAETDLGELRTDLTTLDSALATAQTELDAAEAAAAAAQGDASQALLDAEAAASAASSADSKAATAQTAADTAIADAAAADEKAVAASGLAATKAVVLYQAIAPGVEYQNANTLWIDTTDGANTPKKWVSGTTWEAVTDKAATDAAAAAASANSAATEAQSQADTATTNAATAQAAADAAATAAQEAQGTADTALTAANGKNKLIFSTSDASGTDYSAGDVWFKRAGAIIVGQWEFVAGVWAARTIDNAVIANLNAGKITAGILSADRIGANTINGDRLAANTIAADKIVANSITADQIAANAITAGEIAAQAVEANKIKAGALDAFLITGGNIQTDAAANRGIKINATAILAYDAAGGETVRIESVTGDASFTGTVNATDGTISGALAVTGSLTGGLVRSAATGPRVEMEDAGLAFYDPDAGYNFPATISGTSQSVSDPVHIILDDGNGNALNVGKNSLPTGGTASIAAQSAFVVEDLTVGGNILDGSGTPLPAPGDPGIPYRMAVGGFSASAFTQTVSLPPGRFTVPPIVTPSFNAGNRHWVAVDNVTTTSFRFLIWNGSGSGGPSPSPLNVSWLAVQMTPTSAEG